MINDNTTYLLENLLHMLDEYSDEPFIYRHCGDDVLGFSIEEYHKGKDGQTTITKSKYVSPIGMAYSIAEFHSNDVYQLKAMNNKMQAVNYAYQNKSNLDCFKYVKYTSYIRHWGAIGVYEIEKSEYTSILREVFNLPPSFWTSLIEIQTTATDSKQCFQECIDLIENQMQGGNSLNRIYW